MHHSQKLIRVSSAHNPVDPENSNKTYTQLRIILLTHKHTDRFNHIVNPSLSAVKSTVRGDKLHMQDASNLCTLTNYSAYTQTYRPTQSHTSSTVRGDKLHMQNASSHSLLMSVTYTHMYLSVTKLSAKTSTKHWHKQWTM